MPTTLHPSTRPASLPAQCPARRRTLTLVAGGLALLLVTAAPAHAQSLITRLNGELPGDLLGFVMGPAGDVDDDGTDDVAVGVPDHDQFLFGAGQVRIVSGATGAVIRTWDGAQADHLGSGVAHVGDVNRDGHDDVAVSAWGENIGGTDTGTVRLVSGLDGSVLWETTGAMSGDQLGSSLDTIGDLDGDGFAELVAGAPLDDEPGLTSIGAVLVLRGSDGSVMRTHFGDAPGDQLGRVVRGVGDLNDDGFDDYAAGSDLPFFDAQQVGLVRAWSGFDGAFLFDVEGPEALAGFGTSLGPVGDVDLDGHDDLGLGLPHSDLHGPNAGRLLIVSGDGGGVIDDLAPPGPVRAGPSTEHVRFGTTVDALDDLDGDGFGEFAVGAPGRDDIHQPNPGAYENAGAVRVYRGSNRALMYTVYGNFQGYRLGSGLATLADLDGDGLRDFAAGEPGAGNNGPDSGQVRVFSARPNWEVTGPALPGTNGAPILRAHPMGGLYGHKPVSLALTNARPSAPAVVLIGLTRLDLPLNGGTLVPNPDILIVLGTDVSGALSFGGSFPSGVPSGFQFWIQEWIIDAAAPLGWAASNGLQATTP